MRTVDDADLLALWEAGETRPAMDRGLLLLDAVSPDAGIDALARLTVGERDAALLTIRERVFGSRLSSVSHCPACATVTEHTFHIDDVRVPARGERARVVSVEANGRATRYRLPNSEDLASITGCADVQDARIRLVERCLIPEGDQQPAPMILDDATVELISRRMAECDPQADVVMAVTCPSCSQQWSESFDILSFLWTELDAWASRVLDDVHRLASAYGWPESDILAMTPARREAYLSRIGA
jgi:hypothetical protein